uniref:WAP domain-containing protein n=1 Tax=Leptobrachium leishanense TaxID=445787 RepID=A0A8C5PZL7_9ANUR
MVSSESLIYLILASPLLCPPVRVHKAVILNRWVTPELVPLYVLLKPGQCPAQPKKYLIKPPRRCKTDADCTGDQKCCDYCGMTCRAYILFIKDFTRKDTLRFSLVFKYVLGSRTLNCYRNTK